MYRPNTYYFWFFYKHEFETLLTKYCEKKKKKDLQPLAKKSFKKCENWHPTFFKLPPWKNLGRSYLKKISCGTQVIDMSFDKLNLAVESRDLSQADKSIIRVSCFPSWVMDSRTSFSISQQLMPQLSAKWMLSILSDLPLTRITEKSVYFSILQIFEW